MKLKIFTLLGLMKKHKYLHTFLVIHFMLVISVFYPLNGGAQISEIVNNVSSDISSTPEDKIGAALKQALEYGVNSSVQKLSADKGYLESPYKILVPDGAQLIIMKVKMVSGFEDVEKQLISKMNKAAELAAKKATPVFVKAITEMTIRDAMNILKGDNDAATRYLEIETKESLYSAFMPVIQSALDEAGVRTYWKSVVTAYNNIPFVKKKNPSLDDHVNQKALDGLFSLIEEKELKIRTNKAERKTELLKTVFAQQDKS